MPRPALPEGRPLAIAHRYGNEVELARAAHEAGADLVEADVWPHRGRLEVRHLKTMGPVPLLWDRRPYRLVSARAPRLQLPELVVGYTGSELMLDLKGRDVRAAEVVRDLVAAQLPGTAYTVCSQSWQMLAPFASDENARVVHSVGSDRMLRTLLPRLPDLEHAAVSIDVGLLTPQRVERLRERAELVMTWRVNDMDLLGRVLDWGVTGVITDSLDVVRALRARSG